MLIKRGELILFKKKKDEYEMKGSLRRYEYINFMGRISATLFLDNAYRQNALSEDQAKSLLQDSLGFQFWLTTSYINWIFMKKYRYSLEYQSEVAVTALKFYSDYYRQVTSCKEKTAKNMFVVMYQSYGQYGVIMDKKANEIKAGTFDTQIVEALAAFFVQEIKHKYEIPEDVLNAYFTAIIKDAVEHVQDKMKKVKKIKEKKA